VGPPTPTFSVLVPIILIYFQPLSASRLSSHVYIFLAF
jgi:hypothetical protein